MTPYTLRPLSENEGLACIGEPAWAPASITSGQAQVLGAAVNPCRRSNRDVLRAFAGFEAGRKNERWQIDFPAHLTASEAALYEKPFRLLKRRCKTQPAQWWINPHGNPILRNALARMHRYLAAAAAQSTPSWNWVGSDWLPDSSMLAVLREDDLTCAILQSRLFAAWWRAYVPQHATTLVVESFPFPWRPSLPLGSLTGRQQDLRVEVSLAARSGTAEQINAAVATTYGWPASLSDQDLLELLRELHLRRAG